MARVRDVDRAPERSGPFEHSIPAVIRSFDRSVGGPISIVSTLFAFHFRPLPLFVIATASAVVTAPRCPFRDSGL
jgi:hypothetical protein